MRRVVFAEGCALRVRDIRPYVSPGRSWRTRGTGSLRGDGTPKKVLLMGKCPGKAHPVFAGMQSPPLDTRDSCSAGGCNPEAKGLAA